MADPVGPCRNLIPYLARSSYLVNVRLVIFCNPGLSSISTYLSVY